MAKYRVVHYLNQFFAQIGGEEKADIGPEERPGAVGPGLALQQAFGEEYEIVKTVICGDTYFGGHIEQATEALLPMIAAAKPDLFVAGPAFNAGRYGVACGTMVKAVQDNLGIPGISGMFEENPGVDMLRQDILIVKTGNNAAKMRNAVKDMATLGQKLVAGAEIGLPEEDNYHEQGIRQNYFHEVRGSARAIDMLVAKMAGRPYVTEYPMPKFDRVPPSKAIGDAAKTKFAVVTSGGIVPQGNPDRIESSSASKYGVYDITGMERMDKADFMTVHGGYDRAYVTENPNLVVPLDVLRDMEREGRIGSLANFFIATTGTGTSVGNAKRFGEGLVEKLKEEEVGAVIFTST